ncbi:hypothetical protein ACF0H5_020316 [Mactra antiquata]
MRPQRKEITLLLGFLIAFLPFTLYVIETMIEIKLGRRVDMFEAHSKNDMEMTNLSTEYEEQTLETRETLYAKTSDEGDHAVSTSTMTQWTIMLVVNDGFFDFFQNWFQYYKKLALHLPITIIADDDIVYEKLKSACSYCSVLRSQLNISEAAGFKDTKYDEIVTTRPLHILGMLRRGIDVLYVDIDSVWLHNPLTYFNNSVECILQFDAPGVICTGFMAFKSNPRTIKLLQQWHKALELKPGKNQPVFNRVFRLNKGLLTCQELSTVHFPSGMQYFKHFSDSDRAKVVVVHNNWIIGHDVKKERFKTFNLWGI